jgi:hypothetical protein
MDSSEAALLAMQAHRGVLRVHATDSAISPVAGEAVLTKGSAGAYTLAAPATDGGACASRQAARSPMW